MSIDAWVFGVAAAVILAVAWWMRRRQDGH